VDNNFFNKQRNIFAVAIFSVVLLGVVLYMYIENEEQEEKQKSDFAITLSVPEPAPQEEERYTVPEGWRIYQSTRFGFILANPAGVSVREVDEGGGVMTIVFEDIQNSQGFPMFIVPYSEPTISDERFLRDIPSGVRTNVEQIFIRGIEGVYLIAGIHSWEKLKRCGLYTTGFCMK